MAAIKKFFFYTACVIQFITHYKFADFNFAGNGPNLTYLR